MTHPRNLADWLQPGGQLYLGHQEIARNDSAGRAIRSEGSLGSGPVVPGPRGAGHLLRSAGLAAAGCSETPISPSSTSGQRPGQRAAQPAGDGAPGPVPRQGATPRPRPGLTLTSGGKWPWGLRCKTTLRQEHATGVPRPADPARQGAGGIRVQPGLARESGYLKKRSMKVALDTTNILGRGAVKDTCNLLADGIVQLRRTLAAVEKWRQRMGQGPGI